MAPAAAMEAGISSGSSKGKAVVAVRVIARGIL
jgi:hypothetical protein